MADFTDELLPEYNRLNEPSFGELERARRPQAGFEHLGASIGNVLFGGGARQARGQQVFQQAATGAARLQDILLQARQRRDAEIGRQAAYQRAVQAGDNDLANLFLQGKVTPEGLSSYQTGAQHRQFLGDAMTAARAPDADLNALNRQMIVIGGKPVDLTKIEGQNVINPQVTPDAQTVLPTDIGAAMQAQHEASAAHQRAGANAENALAAFRSGPQTDAERALAEQRRGKAGDGAVTLKPSHLTAKEMDAILGGAADDKGRTHLDPGKFKAFKTLQQGLLEAGDPNARNEQYVLGKYQQALGADPTEAAPGAIEIPPDLQAGFDYAAQHGGKLPASAPVPTKTATGPNGQKIGLVNGQWIPLN